MKRARRSELFYFAVEEGSSQAISQLPFLPAGGLFLLGFPLCSFLLSRFFPGLALSDFLFGPFLSGLLLGLTLSRLLLGFALCSLLLSLAFRYFFLSLFLFGFFLSLTLGRFLLGLFLGRLFLRLALGYLFLSLFLFGFFLSLTLGDFFLRLAFDRFLLGLFLCYFFLGLSLSDFFLRYAAFFRRCFFPCSYFPLLSDFSLRSFFTSLLFGSHAFLRVGYPGLSIYNKIKKTSKLLACKEISKNVIRLKLTNESKAFRSTE
jgi:hypothetical protein